MSRTWMLTASAYGSGTCDYSDGQLETKTCNDFVNCKDFVVTGTVTLNNINSAQFSSIKDSIVVVIADTTQVMQEQVNITGFTTVDSKTSRRLLAAADTTVDFEISELNSTQADDAVVSLEAEASTPTIVTQLAALETSIDFATVTASVADVVSVETLHCEGTWTDDDCSTTCDYGTYTRTFSVTQTATADGDACLFSDGETNMEVCYLEACSDDVDLWANAGGEAVDDDELSDGEIAATVLAVLLFVGLIIAVIICCVRSKKPYQAANTDDGVGV